MRFNYLDYEIDYQEHTGDTCVYQNDRRILLATMTKWLATKEVIDNVSFFLKLHGFSGREE